MKAIEQYFPVVLFIMLYKMVLTFGSMLSLFCYSFVFKFVIFYFVEV